MKIRKAEERDIPRLLALLGQVLQIHAEIRPDIFIPDTTKYTVCELAELLKREEKPIYVAVDEDDVCRGYAFCQMQEQPFSTNMVPFKSLFIDDLCVDRQARGQHIGESLFEYVKQQAKEQAFIDRERQQKANRKRTSAATISRNRQNATQMQRGFVVFLMIASIAVLFSCIHYLQLKSELTYKMQTVANLESELEELRNYNDAYENEVLNSVDLEEIKQKAIGKLGMKYPDAEHVQEYDANSKGYMRQYQIVGEEK